MATQKSEKIIRGLFDLADIQVNGNNPWDIQVHDKRFYARVLCDAELGVGESYMDGWWDCEAIDQMVDRALRARLELKIKGDRKIQFHMLQSRLLNLQTATRAYEVGQRHYDLGNDLLSPRWKSSLTLTPMNAAGCGFLRTDFQDIPGTSPRPMVM